MENPRYDRTRPRKALRYAAERGVKIYIPAAELVKAGYPLDEQLTYRVWGTPKGIAIRLYREGTP